MLEIRQFSFDTDFDFDGVIASYSLIGNVVFDDLKNNYETVNYISFDGLGIDLEDENKVFYDSGFAGFISCDVSGNTKTEDGYILPNPTSGLIIEFSSTGGALPADLTLLFYGHCCSKIWLQYSNGDNSAAYEEYIDVTDTDIHLRVRTNFQDILTGNVFDTTSFRIVCLATPLPNQAIKLQSIVIGRTNLFNKIKSSNLLEEINILSDDLPVNSFECDVVTDDSVLENDVLTVYSNNKFYGNFFVDDVSRIGKNIYSIRALNSLSRLDKFQFEDWSSTTIQLDEFLSNLQNTTDIPIERDDAEIDCWVFGHVPINTYRYTLCVFAYACRYMVDSARRHGIKLKRIPTEISSVITTESKRIIGECTFTKTEIITDAVFEYAWDYGIEYTQIATKGEANRSVKQYFDNAPVNVWEGNNPNITIYKNTLNYIYYKANTNVDTLDVEKINFVKESVSITNPDVTVAKNNIKNYNTFDVRGYIKENGLISSQIIDDKAKDIKNFIRSTGIAKGKIILEDEKVGDLIQIETAFDGIITGIIISMNISFGYKDIADIEVLEWRNG